MDTIQFVQFLIHLRKNNPCFRYDDYDMIRENVKMENIDHRMIQYSLHQENGEYSDIIVYFNASTDDVSVDVEDGYSVLFHTQKGEIVEKKLVVNGVCLAILVR